MANILDLAIEACKNSQETFCKFISANDAGATGGHQSGFYIPHNSYKILFDSPGTKGANKEKFIPIKWPDEIVTESKFTYYGKKSRNEYRITRFGKKFPFLNVNSVGNLFILTKKDNETYEAFVLNQDEDIDNFLSFFGMSPAETNRLIDTHNGVFSEKHYKNLVERLFEQYISTLDRDFPSTSEVSSAARIIYEKTKDKNLLTFFDAAERPDRELLNWLDTEYGLFKAIEIDRYNPYIQEPFKSVNLLVEAANTILNRRKSRAGKSLEHHLNEIFTIHKLPFTPQPRTEGKKKPDFIFPGQEYYFDKDYSNNLVFLAAKTTCKDRWRQILSEADRIDQKHLFTLQQGISENQLDEMYEKNVVLVIPEMYRKKFPEAYRKEILSLKDFITHVKDKCSDCCND